MWHPNRAQWRVIWAVWAVGSVLWLDQDSGGSNGSELLILPVLTGGALLVWKLQKSSKP